MASRSFWTSLLFAVLGYFGAVTAVPPGDRSFLTVVSVLLIFTGLFVGPLFAWRAGLVKGALLQDSWLSRDYQLIEKAEASYARKRERLLEKAAALEKIGRTDA